MSHETVKVLCVDDDPYVINILQRFLSKGRFEVLTAGSAERGVELFRQCGPVQIVIADFSLPSMTSSGFLRFVKQSSPETLSILMSSRAAPPDRAPALDEDLIFRRLSKPWARSELKQVIGAALEQIAVEPGARLRI